MNRLSTISMVVIDTVSEASASRVARRRPITASSGRIVSPYPNVNASTIESTIEAALPSPIAVAITIPSTSPIAQPVRQCRVAARARRQTSRPPDGAWS